MEQQRIARTAALGIILIGLVFGMFGFVTLVVPALVTQVGVLATGAPTMQGQLADYLASIPLLASSANAEAEALYAAQTAGSQPLMRLPSQPTWRKKP